MKRHQTIYLLFFVTVLALGGICFFFADRIGRCRKQAEVDRAAMKIVLVLQKNSLESDLSILENLQKSSKDQAKLQYILEQVYELKLKTFNTHISFMKEMGVETSDSAQDLNRLPLGSEAASEDSKLRTEPTEASGNNDIEVERRLILPE